MQMRAKQRTQTQIHEDCLVYDKPVILQKQIPDTGAWTDVQHLHANVNKAVSTQNFSAENERLRQRLLFRLRYYAELENVRHSLQDYRIDYSGQHFELVDYDDYNERRRVIKLTGELYELPITVELLTPTTVTVLGVPKKTYPASGVSIDCAWETLTGEERKVNGIVSVVERARITVRSRTAIAANCAIKCTDGTLWEIAEPPENTGLSDRWQVFTVRRISGGA